MSKMKKLLFVVISLGTLLGIYTYERFQRNEMIEHLEAFLKESEQESVKFYERLITDYPKSSTAVYALFKLNKNTQAKELLTKLITNKNDSAIFLRSKLAIETDYLIYPTADALKNLQDTCKKYVEPCLSLSEYYRKINEYNNAYKYLLIAEASNKPEVYADLMYLFSSKQWIKYDPAIAKGYAVKLENSVPLKNEECSGSSKGLFELTEYKDD